MKEELENKIRKIIESTEDTPDIFRPVLKKEMALSKQEEILGVVNIKREYVDKAKKDVVYARAILLIATNFGLISVEEAQEQLKLEYGGYRIRHVMYSKISSLDFDSCLLTGLLKIEIGSNLPSLVIEFNTSRYYLEIEEMADLIRGQMIEYEYRLTR